MCIRDSFCRTSGRFRSPGSGLANFTRYNISSSVLATVRSWIAGFLGRRCLNSWFICASVSRQFSFIMSFRHSSFHHLLGHDLLLLVVSPRSFPLRDPSLSQVPCNDTSCRRPVHSDCSGYRQIIFTNIFEGLNNSFVAVQVRFCFLVAWFSRFFLSPMRLHE